MKKTTKSASTGASDKKSKYNPSRGGHAPGDLREEFGEFVGEDSNAATDQGRLKQLCGMLWNCSDIMPSGLCSDLNLPPGSTYAKGARYLK